MSDLSTSAKLLTELGAHPEHVARLVEDAADHGAERVLERLGLHDENAGHDIRELRTLLDSWRAAKRTAWQSLVRWAVTIGVALILASLAIRLRLPFWGSG